MLLPPPDISAAYVDDAKRPSKDFYNWIKSLYDTVRGQGRRLRGITGYRPGSCLGDRKRRCDRRSTAAIDAAATVAMSIYSAQGSIRYNGADHSVWMPLTLIGAGRTVVIRAARIAGGSPCRVQDSRHHGEQRNRLL